MPHFFPHDLPALYYERLWAETQHSQMLYAEDVGGPGQALTLYQIS